MCPQGQKAYDGINCYPPVKCSRREYLTDTGDCKPCQLPKIQSYDGRACQEFDTKKDKKGTYYGNKVNDHQSIRGLYIWNDGDIDESEYKND